MKRFLIFSIKPVCYNSYLYFADSLAKALRGCGAEIEFFSSAKEPLEAMERLANQTFDAIFDFNSELPRVKMDDGSYFLDQIHAPFYDIILDHPLYHHDTLKQKISDFHVLCLDQNHAAYICKHYTHIKSAAFFPMTGEDLLPDSASYPQKQTDLLFSGTYTDYRQVEQSILSSPSFLGEITKKLIDRMQNDVSLTQEDALRQLLPSLEESEIIEETFPLHMQACFLCDSYLRAFSREELLLSLAREKLPLTLCGNGWRKSPLSGFSQINIIDDISFSDTFALFRQSKITLNLLPGFKNGTHDRIYSSMLNHSLCLTDASPLLKEQFQDGKDLCFYDASQPKEAADKIAHLLTDKEHLETISQNGYFKAKENHSWLARAVCLLKMI